MASLVGQLTAVASRRKAAAGTTTPEHQRDSEETESYYERGRCSMLKSMSAAAAGVVCVRRRRRRVWSRVVRTSRRESSSTGEQSHTDTHTNTSVARGIRVIACVCMSAAAIKTRPAESLATLPAYDRVCECCVVRVRVRACVYVTT